MNAGERWKEKINGHGLFFNQVDSERIVTMGELPDVSEYNVDYVAVKYGGDWGGLWGTPETWGKLSKLTNPTVIPYLYCLPEHYTKYRDIVGGFFEDGYPAVILDCEMEWQGNEAVLDTLLSTLNLADNLIGLTGYAWFNGWNDDGKAFVNVLRVNDVVYLPQVYLSDFNNADNGIAIVREYQDNRLQGLTQCPVYDTVAVGKNPLSDCSLAWFEWCYGKVAEPATDVVTPLGDSTASQINTALGQSLTYCKQLADFLTPYRSQGAKDLLDGITECIHTARRLNNGE